MQSWVPICSIIKILTLKEKKKKKNSVYLNIYRTLGFDLLHSSSVGFQREKLIGENMWILCIELIMYTLTQTVFIQS